VERKGSRISVLLVLAGVLLAGRAVFAQPPDQVAAVTETTVKAPADVKALRNRGIDEALSGNFARGLVHLREASRAAPGDRIAADAVSLLERYMTASGEARQERQAEYRHAVRRVHESFVAQRHVEAADEKTMKKLREAVKAVTAAYTDSGTADELEEFGDGKKVDELKDQSAKALGKAIDAAAQLAKLIGKEDSEYHRQFRSAVEKAKAMLEKQRKAWQAVSSSDRKARRAAARELKSIEYDQTDLLADLETMAHEKPWRLGLARAYLAARLAEDRDKLAKEKWFVDLLADAEARGKKFVGEAMAGQTKRWYDAMSVYSALKELLPDSEQYAKTEKTVQRHVRVLGLYGGEAATTTKSANNTPPRWEEMVANVDVDMVEKVIGQLDLNYVSSIDYRKVTRGGLMSIKVLAETPQAANSFDGLKDDTKRKAFLDAIDRQLREIDRRDRVMHLDLILALNSVLSVSERTVNIPVKVLAVEFADGFLDELDRFSSMIWPSDVSDFQKQTMGHFYGVGIQITKEPAEPLKVVTPLVGTPAFHAGIKSGDLIIKVDGAATETMEIDQLVKRIMGDKGTQVLLTVKRGGRTKDYKITRDRIEIRTVKGWQRKATSGDWEHLLDGQGDIGYIRVTQFTGRTSEHLAKALRRMGDNGSRSVILDLRFNPGGLLRSAAMVANEFIKKGRIVSTRGRRTRPAELNANPAGRYLEGDLVVLINQYSASAAEIVSGALKDWRRAKIVGQRTYGKGSVQNVIPIRSHNAFLKLTTAYYYLPMGRLLHKKNGAKEWGVEPDVEVLITPRQTRRWLDIRRKTDIVTDADSDELRLGLAEQYKADIQLNTAVLMLKLMKLRHRSTSA